MIGATLFSGGRGVEALLTGTIDFRLAVEYDAAIAAVGAQLGGETIVSKVEDVDYTTWPALDYLHASPVCKEYSQAKAGGAEGENDLSSAAAVVRCLEATTPRVFTLENVGAYQHGQAYRRICAWLNHNGYMWHAEVLNSADFGVPQTRRRLILRAVRDALLPPLPAPEPWIGWYAAIEDLIPTLPDSRFADWQMKRLPEYVTDGLLVSAVNADGTTEPRTGALPSFTVQSTAAKQMPRAFIVSNAATEYSNGIRDAAEPMLSVTTQTGGRARAWLVDQQNGSRPGTIRRCGLPAFTITQYSAKHPTPRAWLAGGRVVKMTPRALARFQSLPDWYVLPAKASVACTVIGNMVPSMMMSKIVRPLF